MWYEELKPFQAEHAFARHFARQFVVLATKASHGPHDETRVMSQDKRGAIQRLAKRRVSPYAATQDNALAARYWTRLLTALTPYIRGSRSGAYFVALDRYAFSKSKKPAALLRELSERRTAKDFWVGINRRHIHAGKAALDFLKSSNGSPLFAAAQYHFHDESGEVIFETRDLAQAIAYLAPHTKRGLEALTFDSMKFPAAKLVELGVWPKAA